MMSRVTIITIMALLVGANSLFSQISLGARGGYVMGSANFEPSRYTLLTQGGYNMAFVFGYEPDPDNHWTALQTELIYAERNFSYEIAKDCDSLYTRSIRAVELPLLWRPNFSFARQRGLFYAVLGPYIYYDISSDWAYSDEGDPDSDYNTSGKWEYDSLRDNRLGVGVVAGVGFGWNLIPNLRLMVEGRYVYGFSSVFKPASKYQGNPVQSTTSQINISLGVSYYFNNKKQSN